jgi:guanylate kinase
MLSPDVQARLLVAQVAQMSYKPNEAVCAQLREKSLVMCVGPVAIGKSYIMNKVIDIDSDFRRVPVFTTREARSDDEPGMFRAVEHNDKNVSRILDQIDAGEIVQYVVHPTTGRIYGSTPDDYPGNFNLLAMMSGVVKQLQNIPFKDNYIIGLAASPDTWIERLAIRYPSQTDEKAKRLGEATSSLSWLLGDEQVGIVKWVLNSTNEPEKTALSLIDIVKYNKEDSKTAANDARQMLKLVKEML